MANYLMDNDGSSRSSWRSDAPDGAVWAEEVVKELDLIRRALGSHLFGRREESHYGLSPSEQRVLHNHLSEFLSDVVWGDREIRRLALEMAHRAVGEDGDVGRILRAAAHFERFLYGDHPAEIVRDVMGGVFLGKSWEDVDGKESGQ